MWLDYKYLTPMAPEELEENRERKRFETPVHCKTLPQLKRLRVSFNFRASVYPDDSARVARPGIYLLVFP